jgi:hypothetical protein
MTSRGDAIANRPSMSVIGIARMLQDVAAPPTPRILEGEYYTKLVHELRSA